MESMFRNYVNLKHIKLFTHDKIFNMHGSFENCKSLTSIDLSTLDLKNTGNVGRLFQGCANLTKVDLSHTTLEHAS